MHLDEPAAVFERMVTGCERRQKTLRMFCNYLTDTRCEWPRQCRDRFDSVPSQVCHEWNTIAHLNEYEGRPERRPLTYDEAQRLFNYADDRVERIIAFRRKGALAALRDAQLIKTCYAFGLGRTELYRLDVADLRPNPPCPTGEPTAGCTCATARPSAPGSHAAARCWRCPSSTGSSTECGSGSEHPRPIFNAPGHPALWVTERLSQLSIKDIDKNFRALREGAGLDPALTLYCLRHFYVTHLIEFGYPERFVQEQVGHAYASTTAIYTSISNDFKQNTLKSALKRVYCPGTVSQPGGHS